MKKKTISSQIQKMQFRRQRRKTKFRHNRRKNNFHANEENKISSQMKEIQFDEYKENTI